MAYSARRNHPRFQDIQGPLFWHREPKRLYDATKLARDFGGLEPAQMKPLALVEVRLDAPGGLPDMREG